MHVLKLLRLVKMRKFVLVGVSCFLFNNAFDVFKLIGEFLLLSSYANTLLRPSKCMYSKYER